MLIKELYHCSPSELDKQDFYVTSLHSEIMSLEAREQKLKKNRQDQSAKLGIKNNSL